MRTIITGGSGLIGRALAAELAAAEHEVIVLSRAPGRVSGLPTGVRAVGWDGRSAEGWQDLADGATAIVNLAGESIAAGRWTAARKQRIADSRHQAGAAVVQAVAGATTSPQVVIQASAVGYYGPRGDETITEETAAGDDFLAQICVPWETSTEEVERLGVRRAIIRTGIVLSRDGGALPQMMLPFRLFAGGPLGSGRQGFPWIHLADEVRAIRWLIDGEDASGPFNLAAPETLTNAEFGRVLGRVMRRPSFMPTPGFALRLVLGELSTLLLDGQRQVPQQLLDRGFTFRFPTAEAALRDLLA